MSEQPPSDEPREPEESAPPAPDETAPAGPEAEAPSERAPEVESAPTEAEAPAVEEPVAAEPAPGESESEAEAPAAVEEPVAEEPAAGEPDAEGQAPPEADATGEASPDAEPDEQPAPPARAADPPATDPGAPGAVGPAASGEAAAAEQADAPGPAPSSEDDDGEEIAPRVRPEIPGADLEPDIVLDHGESLTGEGAEDLAEADPAAPLGDAAEADRQEQPIAQAAIDLAAGARYTATGKRKSAVARVIVKPGSGEYVVNGKTLATYFPRPTLQRVIRQPLETVGYEARMDVVVRIHGGGVAAQAGALRHGISRALIEADPNLRTELKRRGFLTRDPRVKERKKAGLKKARKRPQFSKR